MNRIVAILLFFGTAIAVGIISGWVQIQASSALGLVCFLCGVLGLIGGLSYGWMK